MTQTIRCCRLLPVLEELSGLESIGREAVLIARVGELQAACANHGAELLTGIVRSDSAPLAGISPVILEHVTSLLPLAAVELAVQQLGDCPHYTLQYLVKRLPVRSLLGRIASVRDGVLTHHAYVNFMDDALGLAFDLASGFDKFSRPRIPSRQADETTLLLGAARDPQRLSSELRSSRVIQRLVLNEDSDLLAWALENPGVDETTRGYLVSLSSGAVIARLHGQKRLGIDDLENWVESRVANCDAPQIASVFLLEGCGESTLSLVSAALRRFPEPLTLLRSLPLSGVRRGAESLLPGSKPEVVETFLGLLRDWSGSLEELLESSNRLAV